MSAASLAPIRLDRWTSLRTLVAFAKDPLVTMRRLHDTYGPHVELQYPNSSPRRPSYVGCIADAELYREVFSNSETWRNGNLSFRGIKYHASRRLGAGMTRMHGLRHSYYRRLLTPPLTRSAVAAMSGEMAAIAMKRVASWPRGAVADFQPMASHLMQDLAVGLLFGDDHERARPIAEMIERQTAASWPSHLYRYAAWMVGTAPKQERLILEWANQKRGALDPRDILSIVANNPDEYGNPPIRERIGGLISFTFGAAYETCQNALMWTLLLLTQHPKIAADLTEEIRGAMNGGPPTMDKIGALPLLDGVMKEGMRLFPPVPIQTRRSMQDTTLGGAAVKSNTRYLASAFIINRNPEIYPEPDRFRPERWVGLNPSPYDYGVFGAGGRMCPGFTFAGQMVKTALAAILAQHRVDVVADARIDYSLRVTLVPTPGMPFVLRDAGAAPTASRVTGRFRDLVEVGA